jgi:hypothetical protein
MRNLVWLTLLLLPFLAVAYSLPDASPLPGGQYVRERHGLYESVAIRAKKGSPVAATAAGTVDEGGLSGRVTEDGPDLWDAKRTQAGNKWT